MSEYVNRLGAALGALQPGSHGSTVNALQQKLIKLGFKIRADGSYGPATKASVIVMQRTGKVATDGVAGPQTMGVIDKTLASDAATLTASAKGPGRVSARKEARERQRLREMNDAKQAQRDADMAAMRAAAMAKAPVARTGTSRADFFAAKAAEQAARQAAASGSASRSGPAAVMQGAMDKLPLIIGGVAVVGLGVALAKRKRK